jgi:hypothetical protein
VEVLTFTLLERYNLINKLSPGMSLEYLNFEVPLEFKNSEEKDLIELVSSISTSFPDFFLLEQLLKYYSY